MKTLPLIYDFIVLYPLYPTYPYIILLLDRISNMKGVDTMRPLKEKVSITIDSDIVQKIKELSEIDDRSFSQYINMVLKEHLSKIKNIKIGNSDDVQ